MPAAAPPDSLAPEARLARYERLFADRGSPFAFVDLDAMWSNAAGMLVRAGDKPIRVASKSLRCAPLLRAVLDHDDRFRGLLTFTLPETLWLHEKGFADLVLAYPTADRAALARLAAITTGAPDTAPVVMVDSAAQLDLIELAAGGGPAIRVAIEADAGFWAIGGRLKIGAKRSPIRTPAQATQLAREIERRPGVHLAGLMLYEGQIAGLGDDAPGGPAALVKNQVIRQVQKASIAELAERRASIAAAVSHVRPLEFVNGGGTGSLHLTAREPAVTELAAGSGFYAPTLFDNYSSFDLRPAAIFALPVVRKPAPSISTALGGGYPASGAGAGDRVPAPYLPRGLRLDHFEGAGEVQTPLLGGPAGDLAVGDRVYFRHAKAGELCERFNSLLLIQGDEIVGEAPTYRGEGACFL
ncbi:MAG: alanine racemase [Solirubrobacterales bacterium]